MATKTQSTVWFLLRLALGFELIWAFIDKIFGLGFATTSAGAWINGGSPTTGFLSHVAGPFGSIYHNLAGSSITDWLFMLGLLLLGLGLITGLARKWTGWGGVVFMILLWSASLPLKTNPFLDEHIIYALLFASIALLPEATAIGLHLKQSE